MDHNLYLVSAKGEIIWKYGTKGQIWSSPSYYENIIYFGSDDGFIYSVNSDGTLRWKSKLNGKVRSSHHACQKTQFLLVRMRVGYIA